MNTVDLNQHSPRSPRVRLGDFVHLPRLIDKARASVQGTLGVYEYGESSLLDQEFFKFTGLTPQALLDKVSGGAGDWDILEWVLEHAQVRPQPFQVHAWSHWLETLPGLSPEARAWFAEYSQSLDPQRPDVTTLFEYLDLDDYVRFGGQA